MSIYLFPAVGGNPLAPPFEFDGEISERITRKTTWTKKPVEDGADITDYGKEEPDEYQIVGIVTATPWGLPHKIQRVIDLDKALDKLIKARQELVLVSGYWSPTVVITSAESSSAQADGDALRITIDVQTIKRPTPAVVSIPPSRLKPKQKRRARAKTGGASTRPTNKANKKATERESALHKFYGWKL